MTKPHTTLPIPRQPRVVEQGARGLDVVAYKGGLLHAGLRQRSLSESPTFGHTMKLEVVKFQREHGLRGDGVIGAKTYAHLINWVGDYGRRLIFSIDRRFESRTERERYVQNCLWATQTHLYPYWLYAEVRPVPLWIAPRSVDPHVAETDCSGFCDLMARWTSGAPSPMGPLGFSGIGNTDTMVQFLSPVAGTPRPGDLILYDNPGHVVVCIGYPYAVSFGAEPGPIKIDSRYRPASHFRRFLP